jgi:hypothetical protein
LSGALQMKDAGPDTTQRIFFFNDGTPFGEAIDWDDTRDRFEISDTLLVSSVLHVGTAGNGTQTYSYFGGFAPDSADITNEADVYVGQDVELDGELYLNGQLFLDDDGDGAGADASQFVYFHNAGSRTGESLGWDDPDDRFELSDSLALTGPIRIGTATAAPVAYNHVGASGTPTAAADVTSSNDVYIDGDLEVGDRLYVPATIVVGDPTPATNQAWSSFGGFVPDELYIDAADDVFVSGDVEVDGNLNASPVETGASMVVQAGFSARTMIDRDNNSAADLAEWYHDGSFVNAEKLAEIQEDGDLRIRGALSQGVAFDLAEAFLAGEPVEAGDVVAVDPRRGDAVRLATGEGDAAVLGIVSGRPGLLLGGAPFDVASLGSAWGEEVVSLFHAEQPSLRAEALERHPGLRVAWEELARKSEEASAAGSVPGAEREVREERPLGAEAELETRLESLALELFHERHFVAVALAGRVPVKVDTEYGEIAAGDPLAPSPTPGVAMRATGREPVIGTALESFGGGRGKVLAFVHRAWHTPAAGDAEESSAARGLADRASPAADSVTATGRIVLDPGTGGPAYFSILRDGRETGSEVFRVDARGNVYARGSFRPASMDLAEYFPVLEPVETGDVLVADREVPGAARLGRTVSDPAVIGVVSADPGVLLGSAVARMLELDPAGAERLEQARWRGDSAEEARVWAELEERFRSGHAAVALSGTVPCKVDAGYGAIRVGDLLTVSPTPGHAMRASEAPPGTVLGKALEPLEAGTGVIRVLAMLR